MALFLLSLNLGWIQGQFNFTELSLRYRVKRVADLNEELRKILRLLGREYEKYYS